MHKNVGLLALVSAVTLLNVGCVSRAIKEGVGAVQGGKGIVVIITPVEADLAHYSQFKLEPFADATGMAVPQEIKSRLPGLFEKELVEKKIYEDPSGSTLIIRGEYIYYEDANNTTDQVFGPFEEVIARVKLIDAATGAVLGEAAVVGRSTTSVNKGPQAKAEGLAKALVSWISKNRQPK